MQCQPNNFQRTYLGGGLSMSMMSGLEGSQVCSGSLSPPLAKLDTWWPSRTQFMFPYFQIWFYADIRIFAVTIFIQKIPATTYLVKVS